MFGANAFGWPYFGQGYAGSVSGGGGGVTITLSVGGALALAADPPTVPIVLVTSGKFLLVGDDAAFWPITAGQASFELQGDSPALAGPATPNSGVWVVKGDSPAMSGTIAPTASGVLKLVGAAPTLWTGIKPVTGRFMLTSDGATPIPVDPTTGILRLKGDPPVLAPGQSSSGRFTLAANPPNVFLVTATSGRLILVGTSGVLSSIGVELAASGILRLRSDQPKVTPLTEPTPPPPPGTGGLHLTGLAR